MANPGVGSKFLSMNLNKSYGQSGHSSSSNGNYGSGRGRTGGYAGGGGGMVVLSRPRSSHKAGPRLSVPPPVNLPSLRKEHERFDLLSSGSVSVAGVGSGNGRRPVSPAVGWVKPNVVTNVDREVVDNTCPPSTEDWDHRHQCVDGSTKNSSPYTTAAARSGTTGSNLSLPVQPVLRGEDFPSLRATLSTTVAPSHKQKSGLHQNQKQGMIEESSSAQRDGSRLSSDIDMCSNGQSSRPSAADGMSSNRGDYLVSGAAGPSEQARKQDNYFSGPLPLVRLSPRSDWADDERDTSHGFLERSNDHGFSKTEPYWERDFDLPRSSILRHKPAQNIINRWTHNEDGISKTPPTEAPSADSCSRDIRPTSREGHKGISWRASLSKDGLHTQEVSDRNISGARSNNLNHETVKENKYMPPQFGGPIKDDYSSGSAAGRDNTFGRRDVGYGHGGRQQWDNSIASSTGRGVEWSMRERNVSGPESNRHRVDSLPSSFVSKPSLSSGSKGLSGSDFSLNSGRERRSFTRVEKTYAEDWGNSSFDDFDPLAGTLLGIGKRKKDTNKQVDLRDPVRESFEAELERVQKLQEQERQRIIEEQERALELVRKEEEERHRIAREQEEHQRRIEEEAREAAWRAEQERLEAVRRAEEQKIGREQEKERMLMEEERRKQAAKQKLLELEERIARRQAETTNADGPASVVDERMSGVSREGDASRDDELSGWEDSERMVERITNSVPSDSSSLNRSFDVGSRAHYLRDGPSAVTDRGKSNSWRRDVNENSNSLLLFPSEQVNGHHSPGRDAFAGGRSFPRYGANGYMASRAYYRGGFSEPLLDDIPHGKAHRRNISGDGDPYGRNAELGSEFRGAVANRFNEMGWNQVHSHGNLHASYGDHVYQNSELDELYSYGRPKYFSRQPRVLPPPSLSSMYRTSFRNDSEQGGRSAYRDSSIQYDHAARSGHSPSVSIYDENQQEMKEDSDMLNVQEECAKTEVQNLHRNSARRCDSQSSLSISSPPHSAAHLSHDDLDDTGDSPVGSAPAESNEISSSGNDPVLLGTKTGKENMMTTSSAVSSGDDDDEWAIENNNELQEQVEYEEDEDGYDEEDEVHERDDENFDLAQEFEGMHLEGKGPSVMENLVLGFDQGVEVGIPSDENERNPSNEDVKETSYMVPQTSAGSAEQPKSYVEQADALSAEFGDTSSHTIGNCSSGAILEAENTIQHLVTQPTNDCHNSASPDLLNSADLSLGSVLPACHSVHSSADMNSFSSSPAVLSTAASSQYQTEMQVKLHFGLFSGTSPVPSPIPSLQIGSIQMPLPLDHQVGPSLSHIHPLQPTLFQFGQLRYPSPISQGPLPLTSQSMTFSQPNVPANYPLNQKPGIPLCGQTSQDGSSHGLTKDDNFPFRMDNQHQDPPKSSSFQISFSKEVSVVKKNQGGENNADLLRENPEQESSICMNKPRLESSSQVQSEGSHYNAVMNSTSASIGQASKGQLLCETSSSGTPLHGQTPGSRGRKVSFASRNRGQKWPLSAGDASRFDANGFQRKPRRGFQRMEFSIRKIADGRQSSGPGAVDQSLTDLKSNNYRKGSNAFTRSGLQNEALLSRTIQRSESGNLGSDQGDTWGTNFEIKTDKGNGKEAPSGVDALHLAEGRLKRNISSEEDVDAPLQSGVVRIFNQPGIEAPSDEDDFIEVRSKRQMLNVRREQREKEKAKSINKKAVRKPRSTSQGTASTRTIIKASVSSNGEALNSIHGDATQNQGLINEVAKGSGIMSQPLATIGTPSVHAAAPAASSSRSQINRTLQTSFAPTVSSHGQTTGPELDFKSNKKLLDGAQTSSLGSWDNARSNQEVMPLTQTQFDEAMKPGRFDIHSSSVGDHIKSISELGRSTSPVNLKDTPFSSAISPINSLLAGEKIQFGAVTSPTVLHPSSRAVTHGNQSAGSQSDLQISRNINATENDCTHLFEKEKHPEGSCIHLEDCEAEAEAAASAVAVAAISNDEATGNGFGTGPGSMSDSKGFGGADMDGLAVTGVARDNQSAGGSKPDEVLNVSLPADLSVEMPPMSLWPPIPSPHSSSGHMLSPFRGGTPSHFPFYDMNPMLGGPIFAFGPHEESAGSQSQPQKSSTSGLKPLGTWQPRHPGVDSFYGPPAGFTGPFINPSGSIPAGVQGSHMVVYNHLAPVGRYGQVGLSYMGTYISSTKQPDWKHNPASTSAGGDVDIKNLDMASAQHNPPGGPQAQHLAPPLLSMASTPVAMFDVSPFQSSAELAAQARWSHLPGAPSLHSVPQSMPGRQHAEDAMPPQLSHGSSDNHSLAASRFSKLRTQSPPENMVSVAADATAPQKAEKLEIVDPRNSNGQEISANGSSNESFSNTTAVSGSSMSDANKKAMQTASSELKVQAPEQKSSGRQQYNHSSTYNYHRGGGGSQRNVSGAECSNRRMGFHGRNSSVSGGRGFSHTKMKQIYVAKQSSGGTSTVARNGTSTVARNGER